MLLAAYVSLLGLTLSYSAAIHPSLQLIRETSLSIVDPRNLSLAAISVPDSPGGETSMNIDPRFTYGITFGDSTLNQTYAYINTLLALSDLTTKGWTRVLAYDSRYSFSSYGEVIIRIHAGYNPSSLQYRHAIWGLYRAIRETTANGFKECVLSLYWSPILGMKRQIIGYLSILGTNTQSIDTGNPTENAFELALPVQSKSPQTLLTNFTTTNINSTSVALTTGVLGDLKLGINLSGKLLEIGLVFHAVYSGIVSLASYPQYQGIDEPGVVEDLKTHTFLRWDCTHLTAQPNFEYRYAILALTGLVLYMFKEERFSEARVTVSVDKMEVGRGWLYRNMNGKLSGDE